MKNLLRLLICGLVITTCANAQSPAGLFKKKKTAAQSGGLTGQLNSVLQPAAGNNASSVNLSNDDIVAGLKEALRVSTDSSTFKLSAVDGFFKNAALKILLPQEAQEAEKKIRSLGMGKLVDKAILSMNRAAEDAATGAGTIFWDAITQMSITDGLQILSGSDSAATQYLQRTTTNTLTQKFKPVIAASLEKVEATQYWDDVFEKYNMFAAKKVNTDLTAYVTEKALHGLFMEIAAQEKKIRKDPAAQVTGLLQKVFGGTR
jgi:hypothetical protein